MLLLLLLLWRCYLWFWYKIAADHCHICFRRSLRYTNMLFRPTIHFHPMTTISERDFWRDITAFWALLLSLFRRASLLWHLSRHFHFPGLCHQRWSLWDRLEWLRVSLVAACRFLKSFQTCLRSRTSPLWLFLCLHERFVWVFLAIFEYYIFL